MPERVHLTKYEVQFCGYQQLRGHRHLSSFSETIEDLAAWAGGKRLEETKTFETGRSTGDDFGIYCIDVARNPVSGDAVLVTWNEAAHEEGVVSSVNRFSVVGQVPELHSFEVPSTDIPGYPTYFFLMPSEDALFTIRTSSALLGMKGFHKYVEGFLGFFSRFVVREPNAAELGDVIGFAASGNAARDDLIPRFISAPARGRTMRDELQHVRDKIYRIERKLDLNYLQPRDRSAFASRMLGHLGLGPEVAEQEAGINLKTKYSIRVAPTRQQLSRIVDAFEPDAQNSWDDIGFYIKGSAQPIWLRKALRADDLVLDIEVGNQAFLPASDVLRAMARQREALLGRR